MSRAVVPMRQQEAVPADEAVIYLRVSTKEQAARGGEAEGVSIPAQRDACTRKAEQLNAQVVAEFSDAGESARSADRPELQRMLTYLTEHPVRWVIVHKVDRLARNRADDVAINLAIRQARATLVSVTENIDETPSGVLLHGIMSSIAEFYSRNLANEVIKGTQQKMWGRWDADTGAARLPKRPADRWRPGDPHRDHRYRTGSAYPLGLRGLRRW